MEDYTERHNICFARSEHRITASGYSDGRLNAIGGLSGRIQRMAMLRRDTRWMAYR
jgi:hypothetical protein